MQTQFVGAFSTDHNRGTRIIQIFLIFALFVTASYFIPTLAADHMQSNGTPPVTHISQLALEQKYGLQVTLVATTALGGMVDVRLKIVDPLKAQTLLADQANFPVLVTSKKTILKPSADMSQEDINFENGAIFIVLFANSQNAVKPGTPVSIRFGSIELEAIPAQ